MRRAKGKNEGGAARSVGTVGRHSHLQFLARRVVRGAVKRRRGEEEDDEARNANMPRSGMAAEQAQHDDEEGRAAYCFAKYRANHRVQGGSSAICRMPVCQFSQISSCQGNNL